MSKLVVVFNRDNGSVEVMPLEPGGFLVVTEAPLALDERTEKADGTVVLVLKNNALPPSEEGRDFLESPSE